jgi:hypothetical protein
MWPVLTEAHGTDMVSKRCTSSFIVSELTEEMAADVR